MGTMSETVQKLSLLTFLQENKSGQAHQFFFHFHEGKQGTSGIMHSGISLRCQHTHSKVVLALCN